jgi:hypothetical protein
VTAIRIPQQLADAVDEDDYPARCEWLAALPELINDIAAGWELYTDLAEGSRATRLSGSARRVSRV